MAIVIVMAAAFAGVVLAEWPTTRGAGARTMSAAAAGAEPVPLPEPMPPSKPKPIAAPPPSRSRPKGAPLLRPPGADAPARPVVVPPPVPPVTARPRACASPAPSAACSGSGRQNRARSIAGADPARDEEFTFLPLYPREFADAAGDLSEDFEGFVRESFPELIAAG